MNAIPPPAHRYRRAIRRARWVAVLLISIAAGTYVWMRPLPPTWEFPSSARFISVIGVTRDGRVVSLVLPQNEMLPARLCVQDAETGRVISDHLTSDSIYRRGVLTGDDQWVILDSGGMSQIQVVSLKDGTLRYPTFYARDVDVCSADGRFAVMESAERDNYEDYIVDLTRGEFQWKCGDETMFSPDSQRYLTIRRDQGQHFVSVHSLVDNQELLSDIIPDIPGGRYNWLQKWSGDRVYISYVLKVAGSIFGERRCWSYDTRGTRLSDPQFDPTIHSRLINARTYSHQFFRKEYGGDLRLHFPPPEGSILFRIQDTLSDWNLPFGLGDSEYSWQPYSTTTMRPLGGRIGGLRHDFKISPDGRWLADGGEQLRVWRLPATRGWSRWFQTILAAALPWGLLRIRRRGKLEPLSRDTGPDTPPVSDQMKQEAPT